MRQPHNTMIEGFYDWCPVYQAPGMAPNQLPSAQQYQPPSFRPSRNRLKETSRKAEHPTPNHKLHESNGAVFYDRSTGVDLGIAQIDASNNPGTGKVWITPSKEPLTADCNLT